MDDEALLNNTSDGSRLNSLIARLNNIKATQAEFDFDKMYDMINELSQNSGDVKFNATKKLFSSVVSGMQQGSKTKLGMGRRRRNTHKKNKRRTHKRRG
jgi:hypothetical protein